MKKITFLLLITMSLFVFNSCGDDIEGTQDTNYVTFGDSDYSAGIDVGGSATVDIPVYTTNVTDSSRTFNVNIDEENSNAAAGSYTVPSSVTIEGGTNEGILSINLSDVNLGIGVNNLVINFEAVPELSNGGTTTISYTQNCNEITGTLDLSFDNWGSEVYWEILDALDGVVASTAGYPDTASGTTTTDSVAITLCAGRTYTLYVEDGYGDGWGAGSSYTLTIGGVVKVSGEGSGLTPNGVSTAFDTN